MSIYHFIVHVHSVLRWLILISIIIAIANSAYKMWTKKSTDQKDCIFNRLTLILMHVQLLFGLVLYFISPKVVFEASSMKDGLLRFFLVEHILLMVIAVVLVTIGYVKSDRAEGDQKKYRLLVIYYSIALLIILASIPWPFRNLGGAWF